MKLEPVRRTHAVRERGRPNPDRLARQVAALALLALTFVLFLHAGLEWPGERALTNAVGGLIFAGLAIVVAPE